MWHKTAVVTGANVVKWDNLKTYTYKDFCNIN